MIANLSKKLRPFALPLATCLGVAAAMLLIIWAVLARNYGVDSLKKELGKIIESVNVSGYDIAYDQIEFSTVSPFKIMEIKNFKLYKIADTRWELTIPEVRLNADILNYKKLNLDVSRHALLNIGQQEYPVNLEGAVISLTFDDCGFYNLAGEMRDLLISRIAKIETVKFATQRTQAKALTGSKPFLENYLELANIDLLTNNTWNMSPRIDEFYINANIIGKITGAKSYQQALRKWKDNDGSIEVKKLILNWKPLVMVSRGNIYLDGQFNPSLKLITTSKALIETMDNLEKAEVLEKKGVFVSKIVLSNKARKISEDEDFYTIITPLTLSSDEMTIEGIPVWNASQTL